MKTLDIGNVKRWTTTTDSSKLPHPVSIQSHCPHCLQHVVFTTKRRHYDAQRDTLSCSAECPSCSEVVHFWMTNMVAIVDPASEDHSGLYMLPAGEALMNLDEIADRIPANVLQFCRATQDVFQSGNLTATRVMVQSTIDAMFTGFLPRGNSRSTLSKLILDSMTSMDLGEPLMKLATSLRPGEHMDVLFHSPQDVDRETAETLMALIEQLIRFLYILPHDFAELDSRLAALSLAEPPAEAEQPIPKQDRLAG